MDAVLQGTMDAGFAFGPQKNNSLKSIFLCDVDLVIAIPTLFKSTYKNASLTKIASLPWIVPENFYPFLNQVQSFLKLNGIELGNKVFANDDITKIALVQKGAAIMYCNVTRQII